MSWKEIEKDLLDRFGDALSEWQWSGSNRIRVRLRPESLTAAAAHLAASGRVRFVSATALATPSGAVDVWYHFDFFQTAQVLSVRVTAPPDDPDLPSIATLWPNAEWSEREAARDYGVRFWKEALPSRIPGKSKETSG